MATVRDVLTSPFLLETDSVKTDEGEWMRLVSYPELDCRELGENVYEVLERLEQDRIRTLIAVVEHERPAPRLREPIFDAGLEDLLVRMGCAGWIARLTETVSDVDVEVDW